MHPVLIIIGSDASSLSQEYKDSGVELVYNSQWETGMASGIVLGISRLVSKEVDAVIISVCDQPFVTADLFDYLIREKISSKKGIIASSYAGTLGTPVLFDKLYFEKLQTLSGQEGAKKLIQVVISDVATVPFEKGSIDIDTMQDYKKLISGTT